MDRESLFIEFIKQELNVYTVLAFDVVLYTDLSPVFENVYISEWLTNDNVIINVVSDFRNLGMSFKTKAIVAKSIRMKYFDLLVARNGVADRERALSDVFNITTVAAPKRLRI